MMESRQDIVEEIIKKTKEESEKASSVFINEIAMPIAKLQEVNDNDVNK